MRSLSAHLRRPDAHTGLWFHLGCPLCREHVAEVPRWERLVSRRTQAALAAGVLALSAAAPAGALATEPDQDGNGIAAPEQVGRGDTADSPLLDPGGAPADLPSGDPAMPAPPEPNKDDAAALDPEPAKDVDAPVADPGDGAIEPGAQPEPEPTQTPTPSAAAPPMPPAAEAPPAPASPVPSAAPVRPSTKPPRALGERERAMRSAEREAVARARQAARTLVTPHRAFAVGTSSEPEVVQPAPAPSGPVTAPRSDAAGRDTGTHVVRAGESLWSIARGVLGDTASTARLAREVNRLWELNKDRISTGDPDLLMIGTRLRLR